MLGHEEKMVHVHRFYWCWCDVMYW